MVVVAAAGGNSALLISGEASVGLVGSHTHQSIVDVLPSRGTTANMKVHIRGQIREKSSARFLTAFEGIEKRLEE